MPKGRTLILLLALGGLPLSAAHASDEFRFSEKRGEYEVGFKVVQQYDESRVFLPPTDPSTGEPIAIHRARPVQTLLWYPAVAANSAPLKYGDYLLLAGSEDRFDRSADLIRQTAEARLRDYVPEEMSATEVVAIKQQPMWAKRDAREIAHPFPVVIYAPSHNASAAENADICEYLASHGYVVIASSSMGANGRWMLNELGDVEAQVGDIEFLVGYAAALPNADPAHLAVIGYSWGGVANVFAAAKDSRISALIGFDGGIRLTGKLVAEAKYVTPEHLVMPFLYLAPNAGALEDLYRQKQDLSDDLLARLTFCDLYVVTLGPLVHYHFASQHLRFLSQKEPIGVTDEYSLDEIHTAYGWLARYTLAFLDGTLKGDSRALNFVAASPTKNGFPPHFVTVQVNRRTGPPPTRASLAMQMRNKGFSHADEVYETMKAANPGFKLSPSEFGDWIEDLVASDKHGDAIEIARLFVKAYPQRPGPYLWLGDLQLKLGNKAEAIENFRKVLSIAPADERAQRKLAEMGASAKPH